MLNEKLRYKFPQGFCSHHCHYHQNYAWSSLCLFSMINGSFFWLKWLMILWFLSSSCLGGHIDCASNFKIHSLKRCLIQSLLSGLMVDCSYHSKAWVANMGTLHKLNWHLFPVGFRWYRWLFLFGIYYLFYRQLTFMRWHVIDARWFCWRDERWEANDAHVELLCAEATVVNPFILF